jgi:EAL domain-containing protein (putative c-di-GMP-specific phosphodiesterase class I)
MGIEIEVRNQERRLAEYADRIAADADGLVAVHLHLSQLRPEHRRPFHLRACKEFIKPYVERHDGRVFELSTGDMVLVMRDMPEAAVDQLTGRLRLLFAEDPLAGGRRGEERGRLATAYRLEKSLGDFRRTAQRLFEAYKAEIEAQADQPPPVREPLDAHHLPPLLSAIESADLGTLVQRQAICVIVAGSSPQRVFSEATADLDRLGAQLLPEVDLTAAPWYRQVLLEAMLERLLLWLGRSGLAGEVEPITLDTTLSTLMSETFVTFDHEIDQAARKRVIFELNERDLFADLGATMFLRGFLHDRGYRLSLDGTSHLTLPLIERERLGFDFVKLGWGPDYETDIRSHRREALAEAVARIGQARLILYGCDTARAVDAGCALGISLFQGPYVDTLLRFGGPQAARQVARA